MIWLMTIGGMTSTVTNFTSDTLLPIRTTLFTGRIRKCIVKDRLLLIMPSTLLLALIAPWLCWKLGCLVPFGEFALRPNMPFDLSSDDIGIG